MQSLYQISTGVIMKCNVRLSIWFILLFAVLLCAGCSQKSPSNPALILLPGARDVRQTKLEGTDQLNYTLKEAYPARAALKDIKTRLEKLGWKPLEDDYLNPGLPSSHSRGWTEFIDGIRQPNETVQQWLADWQNNKGDIVRYGLVYRSPFNGPQQMDTLQVMEIYVPAKLAKAQRESVLKDMRKNEKQVPAR
jgi:hypothetical protein